MKAGLELREMPTENTAAGRFPGASESYGKGRSEPRGRGWGWVWDLAIS